MPPPFHEGPALDTDAYRHLPQLRERIAPAESSALRVTPQMLATRDERARGQGRGEGWRLSDAQLEASRVALARRLPGLMLTLEPGEGDCAGPALRVDAARAAHESGMVWRREMIRGIRPSLLPLRTPQGEVSALVFAANRARAERAARRAQ